jgi:two-component system, OmpR family, phosphate regulon sensor histidine kinase PhoR
LKLGIRGKLFLVSFGLIVLSFVVAFAYMRGELDRALTSEIKNDLAVRAEMIAHDASEFSAPLDDTKAWDLFADRLGRQAKVRVSLIGADGRVVGDSDVALDAIPKLENHATRPEVRTALSGEQGNTERLSSTIDRRMLYVAVPFEQNGRRIGVARVAMSLIQVDAALARLRGVLTVATLLALGVAVVMSSVAAQLASRTARSLTETAQRMADGDLAARSAIVTQDEFGALSRALDRLAKNLSTTLQELRSERDRLSGILAGMQEGVLLLDRDGRVALVNPALRAMLLLGADAVGKTPLEVIRHAELKQLFNEVEQSDQADTREIEVSGLKPRRLLVRVAPLAGEQRGLFAVFVDVTEMRRLESLRKDFVANVSHELRTPVTAIRSAAETLDGVHDRDPAATRQFIDIIERNAARLQGLVEDLLDLSRIESRELRLELMALEPQPIYEHVVSLFRERADKKGIRLLIDVPDDVPAARADRRALEHILTNLVDNAVKYCPNGAEIRLGAREDGDGVRLFVKDDGPGIEARHLPRLFERFYRVDAGRSRELGGTGLGLSIVKHLVESMRGTVGVESTPGAGTTFHVTLRRAERTVVAATSRPPPAAGAA